MTTVIFELNDVMISTTEYFRNVMSNIYADSIEDVPLNKNMLEFLQYIVNDADNVLLTFDINKLSKMKLKNDEKTYKIIHDKFLNSPIKNMFLNEPEILIGKQIDSIKNIVDKSKKVLYIDSSMLNINSMYKKYPNIKCIHVDTKNSIELLKQKYDKNKEVIKK